MGIEMKISSILMPSSIPPCPWVTMPTAPSGHLHEQIPEIGWDKIEWRKWWGGGGGMGVSLPEAAHGVSCLPTAYN